MTEHETDVVFDYDEENDVTLVTCPCCGTQQPQEVAFEGALGSIEHYRCRYCGGRFYS